MENNNIISAPSVSDAAALYDLWRTDHIGTMATFFRFMTSPTTERDAWLESLSTHIHFAGKVAVRVISTL